MLSTKDVLAVLIPFIKESFNGRIDALQGCQLNRTVEGNVFTMLRTYNILESDKVKRLNFNKQKLLYELLSQYVMFFSVFSDLPFPDYFLMDSSEYQLGKNFLEYIVEHSWPFPQTLPH